LIAVLLDIEDGLLNFAILELLAGSYPPSLNGLSGSHGADGQ
jgi:hypothetical protein